MNQWSLFNDLILKLDQFNIGNNLILNNLKFMNYPLID